MIKFKGLNHLDGEIGGESERYRRVFYRYGSTVLYSSNPRRKMCCYHPCRLGVGVSKTSLVVWYKLDWWVIDWLILSMHNMNPYADTSFSDAWSQVTVELEALTEYSFQCKFLEPEALYGVHIGGMNIKVMRCDLEKLMTSVE